MLLEPAVRVGDGGFPDGQSKEAWAAAAVSDVPLPGGLLDLLRGGRPRQPGIRPLLIKTAEATSAGFRCDRGTRPLAAYQLRIS